MGKNLQVPDRLSRNPHPEEIQPSLRVEDLEQENTHKMIRVTTQGWAKHKVLLNLNMKRREVSCSKP